MRNRDVEEKLNTALYHAVPDVLDSVLRECGEREGKVIHMATGNGNIDSNNAKKNRGKRRWIPVGSVAAIMLLVAGSFYGVNWKAEHTVDSVIAIDVNPSVELKINEKERVLSASALNEDGRDILDGMDLADTDLDVAVNALIGSMMKNGYIDELANSILLTVDNGNAEKGIALQKRLVEEINRILSSNSIDGAILSQNLSPDEQQQKLAEQYGISAGKAALIQSMVAQNGLWRFEDLAKLPINELNLMASSRHAELGDIKTVGTASDKAYIGEAKAKQIVLSHAGLAGVFTGDATNIRVEFDWENGRAVYEVEFYSGATEYDYEIDAVTGAVISSGQDSIDRDADEDWNHTGGVGSETAAAGYIGEEKAKSIALAQVPEATVKSVELDNDDGRMVYELELRQGRAEHDFTLDALTGEILQRESDEYGDD